MSGTLKNSAVDLTWSCSAKHGSFNSLKWPHVWHEAQIMYSMGPV